MAECEVRFSPPGLMAYLTCDLDKGEHAGLNHHDGTYGIWWSQCDLQEHGHDPQPGELCGCRCKNPEGKCGCCDEALIDLDGGGDYDVWGADFGEMGGKA